MSTLPYQSKSLAKSIVADGSKSPNHPVSPASARHPGAFHSIDIIPAENGVTVTHTPHDHKGDGSNYSKKTSHVFSDRKAAHSHIGKLLGCGSGE